MSQKTRFWKAEALYYAGRRFTAILSWTAVVFDGKFNIVLPPEKVEALALSTGLKPRLKLRTFSESGDLLHWSPPRFMMFPDRLDPKDRQIYAHCGFVYESMWIGLMQAMQFDVEGWKQTDLQLTYSRDGRNWLRPSCRTPFLPLGDPDSWEADYHVAAYTAPVLVGDELYFYYSSTRNPARDGDPGGPWPGQQVGLATLRRDGFASLNAGKTPGSVTTRPMQFSGTCLRVNVAVGEGGWVRAAILTRDGAEVPGFGLDDAVPLSADTTSAAMRWASRKQITPPGDGHVRVRFEFKDACLYAFWIE